MDPPTYSEASSSSTFDDQTPAYNDPKARLLEEFHADDGILEQMDSPSSFQAIPRMFSPAYERYRLYHLLQGARVVIFILNFVPFLITMLSENPDKFHMNELIPVAIFTAMIAIIPLVLLISDLPKQMKFYRNQIKDGEGNANSTLGTQRRRILVLDPETGEERWMLQAGKAGLLDETEVSSRTQILCTDIVCGIILALGIVFAVRFGRNETPGELGSVIGVMFSNIVLLLLTSSARFFLMKRVSDKDDREVQYEG